MTDNTETNTEATADKKPSIVDPKYRNKYKSADSKDWVSNFIDEQCRVKSEDGKTSTFDVNKLFELGAKNGGKDAKLGKLKSQSEGRGFIPRMRMTIGNTLRATARKRFGLVGIDDQFHEVDDAFKEKFKLSAPTHTPTGERIKPAKPEAAPAPDKNEAA